MMNNVLRYPHIKEIPPPEGSRINRRTTGIVLLLLVYTVLAGAVRKWFFAGSGISSVLLMIQLVLPYSVLLIRPVRLRSNTQVFLIVYSVLLAAMAMNPMNQTVYHGILGFIIHMSFYLGLLVLVDNRHYVDVRKVDRILIFIIIGELLLGAAQYSVPWTHWLNIVGDGEANDGHAGDSVRVAGTFTHFSGYGAFAAFCGMYVWRMFIRDESYLKIMAVFVMVVVITLMSGSRSSLMFVGVFTLFGTLQQSSLERAAKFGGQFVVGLILVLLLFGNTSFVTRMVSNVQDRVEYGLASNESDERVAGIFDDIIDFRGEYPVFGTGLGGTYQGANAIWGESFQNSRYGYYEEEMERIILEGGFVLLFAKLFLLGLVVSKLRIPLFYSVSTFVLILVFSGLVFFTFHMILNLLGLYLVNEAYLERERAKEFT